ncbi:M23 family metallopeptidase [Vibrio europaeus]|uniref:M23 family metallopeptidase n=1 Tax=Vibrio europaeus TaxID=300876 RepID=UPI0023410782|nr:M23 family metallopeptidase [Vibrio europaeus]
MKTISVTPPLRGNWTAVNTPGARIPSHGTHQFGQTYAYDFVRYQSVNNKDSFHSKSQFAYWTGQVRLSDCYGWGEPIYSPIDGVVREVVNFVKERQRVHQVSDLGLAIYNGLFFSFEKGDVHKIGGNYLIIEGSECCAFIAHAKTGSILPKVGDVVKAGDFIAELGHSGNSTAPHLHFHLMDRVDIRTAKGVPCSFTSYEVLSDGHWQPVRNGVPKSDKTIRFADQIIR